MLSDNTLRGVGSQLTQKGRSSFQLDAITQEQSWRLWFPSVEGVDFAKDLPKPLADLLFNACVLFMESNLYIKVPGKGRIPLRLRDAQKDVLYNWIRFRQTVSLKARQIGFSTLAAAYSLWVTFGYSDRLTIMLSRTEREAIKLLAKVKYNFKCLPEWVTVRGPKLLDKTKQVMTFDNDSSIESLPSANDPARGESVFLVVVDEWAFLPNPDEAWASIEPITDIGGRVIGISTANGEGNFFHNLWLGSQSHENKFVGIFHPWSAVSERDELWYADKLRNMQPWQIAQEYPTTPEEAFVGSGNPVFNLDVIRKFRTKLPEGRFHIEAPNGRGSVRLDEGVDGPFRIWEMPNDAEKWSYVVGADIAQGESYGDYSVAHVVCVQTNRVVAVWHGHCDPDFFGESVLPAIGWFYRFAVVAPEVNNHGLTTLTAMRRAGYGRIYRRRSMAKRQERALETQGWLTTATSKPLCIDELAAWMRDASEAGDDAIPFDRSIAELRAFRRTDRGRMEGSPHDDCVMSLAIAIQARKYAITEHVTPDVRPEAIKGSFAWWEHQLKGSSQAVGVRAVL